MRALRLGLRDIRRQKSRYILVGLSTLLGVLAVVGVGIAGTTAQDSLIAHEEQLRGRAVTTAIVVPFEKLGFAGITDLADRVENRIGAAPATSGVLASQHISVDRDRRMRAADDLSVTWYRGDLNALYRLPVVTGTLSAGHDSGYPATLALNQVAATQLGLGIRDVAYGAPAPGSAPVGLLVTAIVADGDSEPHGYAPLSVAETFLPGLLDNGIVEFRVRSGADTAAATDLLTEVAAQRGVTDLEHPRRVDTVETVSEQLALLTEIFTACAGIVLLVSAVGIANVGMATVAERSHELTIRRALGARAVDVFSQVISASVLVGCAVAVVAVAAAIAGVYVLLPLLLPAAAGLSAPAFPVAACLLGVGAALGTSVLGGVLPAIAATRVPIATALRS